jgi:hypothetical protein
MEDPHEINGMYVCGNCWDYFGCRKRQDKEVLDFPCGNPAFIESVKVIQ